MVTQNSKNKLKQKSLIRLGVGILIVFLLNIALARFYYRIDLTSEKRYTISDSSKKLLQDLDDYAYFKVYLEGDFPAGFKKLRNETRDMLEEFKAYSKKVEYTFINPTEGVNTEKRNQKIQELIDRGLQPTELHVNKKDGSNRMLIFPGIILSYKGYEIPIELLKTQMGVSPEKVLNNSIETLEFNLASSLLKLVNDQKPTVAFLDGHEELNGLALADILEEFSQSYRLGQVKIDGRMSSLFELN
ncbi:MAG: Gldg family protein, partial [Bacteroidales bacterium]|nr:Gldg family protein [Bacteroidales bacterium]